MIGFNLGEQQHTGGYHGTSQEQAERIAEEGFRDLTGSNYFGAYFAPLTYLHFAQAHGANRAKRRGEPTYGVIHAAFPPQNSEFGMLGNMHGRQLEVPHTELGKITILALRIYSVEDAKLLLHRPIQPDQTQ